MSALLALADGVPCSQNPTEAIEAWINFNKEEREAFSESLRTSLKVRQISLGLGHHNIYTLQPSLGLASFNG